LVLVGHTSEKMVSDFCCKNEKNPKEFQLLTIKEVQFPTITKVRKMLA